MSQAFEAWFSQKIAATTAITNLIGKDSAGNPAVFPYHFRDADENVAYPHITFARFGDITERGIFQDTPDYATLMDCPRVAVCVWSKENVTEAYNIYTLVDQILRGPAAGVSSAYFSSYKVRRTHLRDDLFDNESKAYHVHSEYSLWVAYALTAAE